MSSGGAPRGGGYSSNVGGGAAGGAAGGAGGAGYDPNEKLKSVNKQVDTVREKLKQNIEIAVQRGERLDDIDQRSTELARNADQFDQSAQNVRRMFCRRQARNIAIIATIVVVLIVIIAVSAASKSS